MFCANCGSPVPNGSQFCPKCGGSQTADSSPTATLSHGAAPVANSPQPKKSRKKTIIAVCVVVCIVALVVLRLVDLRPSSHGFPVTDAPTQDSVTLDFSDAQVGDIVQFGTYEQDNNTTNGNEVIDWVVLDRRDGKLLVISKNVLDYTQYKKGEYCGKATWETSFLRKWLNNNFLELAFSSNEQAMIQTTNVSSSETDKLFVLSVEEANTYFVSNFERSCVPSYYVASLRKMLRNGTDYDSCSWWLRSTGINQNRAACVAGDGQISEFGCENNQYVGVRPVLWISIEP